jgi:hypothetical protein
VTCPAIAAIHPDFHEDIRAACPRCGETPPNAQADCLAQALLDVDEADWSDEETPPTRRRGAT